MLSRCERGDSNHPRENAEPCDNAGKSVVAAGGYSGSGGLSRGNAFAEETANTGGVPAVIPCAARVLLWVLMGAGCVFVVSCGWAAKERCDDPVAPLPVEQRPAFIRIVECAGISAPEPKYLETPSVVCPGGVGECIPGTNRGAEYRSACGAIVVQARHATFEFVAHESLHYLLHQAGRSYTSHCAPEFRRCDPRRSWIEECSDA
jgi:hypothetical protein